MAEETTQNSYQTIPNPVRKRYGQELSDDVTQQLRDAVWAGLAQRLQADKELYCKQNGHIWITGPSDTMVCRRCSLQQKVKEENIEKM